MFDRWWLLDAGGADMKRSPPGSSPLGSGMQQHSTQGLGLLWQAWPQLLQLCFGRNVPQVSDPETQIQQKVVYLGSSRYTSRVGS